MPQFKDFDQIQVGDTASLTRAIGPDEVRRFVELTGDDNPLHVSRAYAETTPFKDIVVHGMLGASFLSTVIGTQLPGEGALWISQTLDFQLPVRLGDVLTVTCVVEKKHDRERLLDLTSRIENQARQVVLSGKGVVKLLARPQPPTAKPVRAKVALVVGGAGGIGRAISRRLAKDEYSVIVVYRGSEDRALEVVQEIVSAGGEAVAMKADVTDEASVSALVQGAARRFSGLGAVIFAATAPIEPAAFDDLTWEAMRRHLDVQLKGAFLLAKACVPVMRAQGYGRIVHVGSQVSDGEPTPKWTAYSVAKAALATFTRSLAAEVGPSGITVNAVSPGMTDTALIGGIPEKARLVLARQTPLRRLATPEDVAGAVAYLVSSDAEYVTGETLRVNGGQVMR
jgi:3-oxoacyl-[acyl-carrier protein] reductase